VLASFAHTRAAPECIKDGKKYGVVEGNFREEWYSYQERADSYLEGECYEAALSDYERAIELRKGMDRHADMPGCDKRRARAYGMHFIDWFGHRGRGVALYNLGKTEEAIEELEFSLQCTESSQAQYYLDKARAKKLKETGNDTRAPSIKEVRLIKSEPAVNYAREGNPSAAPGYDRFAAVPYYFTMEDIEAIKENLSTLQKLDRGFMRTLKPGWGNKVISWKSEDEIKGKFVKSGKLYLVVESEDDQGVEYVKAGETKSPYTFAQEKRADVFPVAVSSPADGGEEEEQEDPELQEPQELFTVSVQEEDEIKINLSVTDLVDKKTEKTLSLKVDREGPHISIEDAEVLPGDKGVKLKGYIEDDSGVKSFDIQGKTPEKTGANTFSATVPMGANKKVNFEATDALGNKTSGAVSFAGGTKGTMLEPPVRWAKMMREDHLSAALTITGFSRAHLPETGSFAAWQKAKTAADLVEDMVAEAEIKWEESPEKAPPVIRLKKKIKAVYQNRVHIQGSAQARGGALRRLTVNGRQLLRRPARNTFFNRVLYLRPGKNLVRIQAMDDSGQANEEKFYIRRIVPRVSTVSERLAVSLLPFYIEPSYKDIAPVASDNLISSLIRQRRFRYVDRSQVNAAVRELRLSGSGLVEPRTAVRAGKITNAEAIIIGVVDETPGSIEVKAQVVDVETSRVMITRDAYHHDKSLRTLQFICRGLAAKLKNAFPIVQGNVASAGRKATISLGRRNRVGPGMKVVFFKLIPKRDESGEPIGADTKKIGTGTITSVSISSSEVKTDELKQSLSSQDLVMTK
ncbi:MAG: CsgG/HfaB family protein, partial [bacterium]